MSHLTYSIVYIRSNDRVVIQNGFIALFNREGYHLIPTPSAQVSKRLTKVYLENKSYRRDWFSNIIGVALFPGSSVWTIVHTTPNDLLCHRMPDSQKLQIACLAETINADIIMFNEYGNRTTLLVEVNSSGKMVISGGEDEKNDLVKAKERPPKEINDLISPLNRDLAFRLLNVSNELQESLKVTEDEIDREIFEQTKLAKIICGDNFSRMRNNLSSIPDPDYIKGIPDSRLIYFQRNDIPPLDFMKLSHN